MESRVHTFLPGYSIESPEVEHPGIALRCLRLAASVHRELEAPCTVFVRGRILEANEDAFRRLRDGYGDLLDFQQGTNSGVPLKTVCQANEHGVKLFRGGSVDECREDVGRASDIMERVLGVRPIGLAGPLGYYRGLSDRPDLLEVLHELGVRFTRTFTRNARDWSPLSFETQPFAYDAQGFSDMIEIPGQGWPDVVLKEALRRQGAGGFVAHIRKDLDYVAAKKLTWSFVQTDRTCLLDDTEMAATRAVIEHARRLGFRMQTHAAHYQDFAGLSG